MGAAYAKAPAIFTLKACLSTRWSNDTEERKKLKDESIGCNRCDELATDGQCIGAANLQRQYKGDSHENN